jgi:glycosyltransferase involved in cell wall biosynthesis
MIQRNGSGKSVVDSQDCSGFQVSVACALVQGGQTMPDVSVIICTHNPRSDYLRRALNALQAQKVPKANWELLIVDNAGKETLATTWDLSWHPLARHTREHELGLTHARLRGIRESSGELLVFVDDDNVLAPDFLEHAINILAHYPYLGAFGPGLLEPEFEVPPPAELLPFLPALALRNVPSARWSNNANDSDSIPWGAGLCVTRRVANNFRKLIEALNVSDVLGRRGAQLFSGEDDVFSWVAVGGGQGFGLFPELRVTHLIPAARLTTRYVVRLVHDHAFSHGVLRYLLAGIQPDRLSWIRYVHFCLHGIKNGHLSMRCQSAASRGQDSAARFIVQRRLRPIGPSLGVPEFSTPATGHNAIGSVGAS